MAGFLSAITAAAMRVTWPRLQIPALLSLREKQHCSRCLVNGQAPPAPETFFSRLPRCPERAAFSKSFSKSRQGRAVRQAAKAFFHGSFVWQGNTTRGFTGSRDPACAGPYELNARAYVREPERGVRVYSPAERRFAAAGLELHRLSARRSGA